MDPAVFWIFILLILAAVAVYAIRRYRHSSSVDIHTPVGDLKVSGQNEPDSTAPTPGIKAKNIKAEKGDITAIDDTGRGVDAENLTAGQDVDLYSGAPSAPADPDPKADPPT